MVEWLFPTWSNPLVVAGLVAARTLLNAALTAIVVRSVGRRSPLAAAAGIVTVAGAATMILVLRPGWLGHRASIVDLLAQLGLLALGGYAVYERPTVARGVALGLVALATLAVLLVSIPLYGEATVAP